MNPIDWSLALFLGVLALVAFGEDLAKVLHLLRRVFCPHAFALRAVKVREETRVVSVCEKCGHTAS